MEVGPRHGPIQNELLGTHAPYDRSGDCPGSRFSQGRAGGHDEGGAARFSERRDGAIRGSGDQRMSTQSFFPPTPEVQHLPTLFRRIQQGEIRVPAFQRGFVWTEAQILQLLESVYRGFPIGSLLFWSVKEQLLRIEHSAVSPFPDVVEKYPLKFLLD